MTPIERFLAKVEVNDAGCWVWTGALTSSGYANFWSEGRYVSGHRFSYTAFVGPIPDELHLDHLCRVHACVNPDHLEPVTQRENTLRGETLPAANVAKTHCPKGHPYTPENTYIQTSGRGGRSCLMCRKASNDRLTQRRQAARKAVA